MIFTIINSHLFGRAAKKVKDRGKGDICDKYSITELSDDHLTSTLHHSNTYQIELIKILLVSIIESFRLPAVSTYLLFNLNYTI